jgi:hypothetical protein
MTRIWYLVTNFILVCHIVGSVFGPVRFLLPVCRLSWFLYCELMLTYDTPALRQTESRNLSGQKTLPTIWGTYMKLVTKYQISAINSCWEKCDEKWFILLLLLLLCFYFRTLPQEMVFRLSHVYHSTISGRFWTGTSLSLTAYIHVNC